MLANYSGSSGRKNKIQSLMWNKRIVQPPVRSSDPGTCAPNATTTRSSRRAGPESWQALLLSVACAPPSGTEDSTGTTGDVIARRSAQRASGSRPLSCGWVARARWRSRRSQSIARTSPTCIRPTTDRVRPTSRTPGQRPRWWSPRSGSSNWRSHRAWRSSSAGCLDLRGVGVGSGLTRCLADLVTGRGLPLA